MLILIHDRYAWYIVVQILYNKKMRMQIKYNVYFKNPKFVKEVTHSNQLVEKQLN